MGDGLSDMTEGSGAEWGFICGSINSRRRQRQGDLARSKSESSIDLDRVHYLCEKIRQEHIISPSLFHRVRSIYRRSDGAERGGRTMSTSFSPPPPLPPALS